MMAMATPTPDAAIRLTVLATMTTSKMTAKSSMVSLALSNCSECQSIILKPITINNAAKADTGTHAMTEVNNKIANNDHTPWNTPDKYVVPPLALFTKVAPIVPAPGAPPMSEAAKLPKP